MSIVAANRQTSIDDGSSKINIGSTISVFLSKYLDKNGELNDKGQQVFGYLGINPDDLIEKSLEDFVIEEKQKYIGPDRPDKESMRQIAELKLDRYEKRRHFKAQQIKQHELTIQMTKKEQALYGQMPRGQLHLMI